MTGSNTQLLPLFQTLVDIVARLRGPDGCPWDKEQTDRSLSTYIIEEAFELVEAIESQDSVEIKEELGDFLFQVILQAQVAQDAGRFDLAQVIAVLNEKMIRRHPHVFSGSGSSSLEEVWKNWDKIKTSEKTAKMKVVVGESPVAPSLFNYPRNLPALQAATKIGRKTETWKFDWHSPEEVLEKVREEFHETEEALQNFRQDHPGAGLTPQDAGREKLEHEIGDLLFSTAQFARHLGLDPEACLRQGNRRFEKRFQAVVAKAGLSKDDFVALPDSAKEALWREIKQSEVDKA